MAAETVMREGFRQQLRAVAKGLRARARRFPVRARFYALEERATILEAANALMHIAGLDYPTKEELDRHSWQRDDWYHGRPVPG